MKRLNWIVCFAAVAVAIIATVMSQMNKVADVGSFPIATQEEKLARWQSDAQFKMLVECTNKLAGINKIIRVGVDDVTQPTAQWRGTVVADYVNRIGGIERTNIYYKISFVMGSAICIEDHSRL